VPEAFTAEDRELIRSLLREEKRAEPSDYELERFVRQCERTNLDPFDRQIYAQFRRDRRSGTVRMQVQGTIDGFRLVAERSGKYLGQDGPYWCGPDGEWVDVWLKPEPPSAAKVGVYKQGLERATYSVALFKEYAQRGQGGALTGLWPTMPANQLAKCSEALALRRCFPDKLSGIYTTEEMGQADNPVESEAADITAQRALTARSNGAPEPEPVAFAVGGGGVPPDKSSTPETIAKTEPARDANTLATPGELDALRELIRVTETGEPFVRMQLIAFGIEDVGTIEEMLPKLTVAQALHVMTKINERMTA
jgi:phage recombination protein Bet